MFLSSFGSTAQVVINAAGVTITVNGGTQLVVEGGAQLNTTALFENDGSVRILGDWTNNSGGLGFKTTSMGSVYLHNTLPQSIQGTAVTDFRNLVISGGTKTLLRNAQCGTAAQPDGSLTLNSGVLLLNTRTFSLYNPASASLAAVAGSVRSETTDLLGRFRWALGSDVTEHRIPFTDGSNNALPFAFTPSAPYPANTMLDIATYHTAADNTLYPVTANQQVLHMAGVSIANNTANVVDRFWLTDLPNASFAGTLLLSHTPADDASLGPGAIRAQRWLGTSGTWQPPIAGQTNPLLRQVMIPAVPFSTTTNPENEHIWAMAYDATPLPIELVSFDAQPVHNHYVHCTWTTAAESDNDFFTVERSRDATTFEAVGTVPGAGNSFAELHYAFDDPTPFMGLSYYRLRQTDLDGSTSFSQAVPVNFTGSTSMQVFPNPSNGTFTLQCAGLIDDLHCTLHDATGRAIQTWVMPSGMDRQSHTLDLASGVYHLDSTAGQLRLVVER